MSRLATDSFHHTAPQTGITNCKHPVQYSMWDSAAELEHCISRGIKIQSMPHFSSDRYQPRVLVEFQEERFSGVRTNTYTTRGINCVLLISTKLVFPDRSKRVWNRCMARVVGSTESDRPTAHPVSYPCTLLGACWPGKWAWDRPEASARIRLIRGGTGYAGTRQDAMRGTMATRGKSRQTAGEGYFHSVG